MTEETCTVVTVAYRGGNAVNAWALALEAALDHPDAPRTRVIVVDNASGDDTVDRLRVFAPWATLIENSTNAGFAAGVNQGLREIGPDVARIIVLNPDVIVPADFLAEVDRLTVPDDIAAVGPLVRATDGSVEQSARGFPGVKTALFGRTALLGRLFPNSRMARRELRARPGRDPRAVDWVSGACMIIPRTALDLVGGFDTRYFMYWEDADWCKRARDRGLRVQYNPTLTVRHRQGSSSRSRQVTATVAFHRSAATYYSIHVSRGRAGAMFAATLLAGRLVVKIVILTLRRTLNSLRIPPRVFPDDECGEAGERNELCERRRRGSPWCGP